MRRKSDFTKVSAEAKTPAEKVLKDIRRATRRHHSAEEKIRVVLEGLRGEESIAELCRREGIATSMYYVWSKEFLEAGKRRLTGDTARSATTDEVKALRREAETLRIGVEHDAGGQFRSDSIIACLMKQQRRIRIDAGVDCAELHRASRSADARDDRGMRAEFRLANPTVIGKDIPAAVEWAIGIGAMEAPERFRFDPPGMVNARVEAKGARGRSRGADAAGQRARNHGCGHNASYRHRVEHDHDPCSISS